MINTASKILLNFFLPDIDSAVRGFTGAEGFAVSPIAILETAPVSEYPCLEITAGTAAGDHCYVAEFRDFAGDIRGSLSAYAENLPGNLRTRTGMLLKTKLSVRAAVRSGGTVMAAPHAGRCAEIRLIAKGGSSESGIRVYFPLSVLEVISGDVYSASDGDDLEKMVVGHFRDPLRIFPNLDGIMEALDIRELRELFYQLQKRRLLTTYQLCLVVTAYPEHALRVKRCLSANTVRDVTALMRSMRTGTGITRRDLAGGVYSVEEAVHMLMMRGADFRYASFLRGHQDMVNSLARMELLLRLDFSAWLERMEEDSLLYHTLAVAGDKEIARALSGGHGRMISLLEKNLSARRSAEITDLAKEPCTLDERLSARCRLVSVYRTLRIKRRNWGAESFEYLLRCMGQPSDFRRLLLEAGWFTLSTALKGTKPALVKMATEHLPHPARFLIEDVLRGVINPNILHDELQVDAARRSCVGAMCALEEEGVITLQA